VELTEDHKPINCRRLKTDAMTSGPTAIRYLWKKGDLYISMRYKLFAVVILLLASISLVSAFTPGNVDNNAARYNIMASASPAILRDFIGDQTVNVNIINSEGSTYKVGFVTQNAKIVQTVPGGANDPSVVINATSAAVDAINSSDDPIAAFEDQTNYGQIRIQGTNPVTSLKLAAVLSSGPVLEFFYNVLYANGSE
jgi:hypothetical protein